jgi:glycerol uptake facilitator-like aquaporin
MSRRLCAELVGTALLVAAVIGSGIMGEILSQGNAAIALLGNTLATAAALIVLITVFGPVSGAHFNPVVSAVFAWRGEMAWRDAALYLPCQVIGAILGAFLAHAMFGLAILQAGDHTRTGAGQWLGEVTATFALLIAIIGTLRARPEAVASVVGLVIAAGYWFTSSTSFANPAVTIARSLTTTFAGIRPVDAPGFIAAQVIGGFIAIFFAAFLWPKESGR